ncbi:hypothetical protein A4X03_0g9658 [Tilletia caries]|uniref:YchF C-terminal domain-containing protein n=1 Tax=Tilletia caries TaxID=13290 RepID=A0A8T8S9X0_9BASI|nr:hypothetical protein A4X03_0g9658 [Tilletia caries]
MLADLESLERRVEQARKRATGRDKEAAAQLPVMEAVIKVLNEGKPARVLLKSMAADEIEVLKGLNLLTSHPVLYVCNVAEVAQLPEEEATEFLSALGLDEAGLDRLIRAGYHLLDLITYFTVGPKETRAWTIVRGTKAPAAAGVIHTDFERGFIRAFAYKGEVGAKEAGKGRDEGKEYVVNDGDVIHFRFNT